MYKCLAELYHAGHQEFFKQLAPILTAIAQELGSQHFEEGKLFKDVYYAIKIIFSKMQNQRIEIYYMKEFSLNNEGKSCYLSLVQSRDDGLIYIKGRGENQATWLH